MFRKNLDLVFVSLTSIISALLGISGWHSSALLSVFGILLVLVLPGYVFSQLLQPHLPFEERLLVTLGLSVVIDGLSGLILNLTSWGLTSSTWGLWLATVTLVGVCFLWPRREESERTSLIIWPKITWHPVLLYGLGFVFILLAFGIARFSSTRLDSPLTMLWADYDHTNPQVLNFGILNKEGKTMAYDLVIEQNGVKAREWDGIQLEHGNTFSGQLSFQQNPQYPVNVLLYLPNLPSQVYRQVKIVFPEVSIQIQGK